jgi:hypothetical protein
VLPLDPQLSVGQTYRTMKAFPEVVCNSIDRGKQLFTPHAALTTLVGKPSNRRRRVLITISSLVVRIRNIVQGKVGRFNSLRRPRLACTYPLASFKLLSAYTSGSSILHDCSVFTGQICKLQISLRIGMFEHDHTANYEDMRRINLFRSSTTRISLQCGISMVAC